MINKTEGTPDIMEQFDFLNKYENDNPIVIPDEVLESIEKRQKEYDDPDLTRERWDELNRQHQEKMSGVSDDDLYYQLYFAKKYEPVLINVLEGKLRPCHCGSGKRYSDCHGK